MSLTVKRVARLVRAGKPGKHADGGHAGVRGLHLLISSPNAASWGFRYWRARQEHWMGLGSAHLGDGLSLDQAREKGKTARAQLRDGLDPLGERQAAASRRQAEALGKITFSAAVRQFITQHQAGWKNAKHAQQVHNTLRDYVLPLLGGVTVDAIDTPAVLRVLEPIWLTKTETASRVRGRIEAVLGWATVRGYRHGDNPARWRGHLDQALPQRTKVAAVERHPALPYAELPIFMGELRQREGTAARALEFLILTAARSGEVLGATWDEIDLDNAVWVIPAARMKASREHRVPLSARALELLQALPREPANPYCFVAPRRAGGALSKMNVPRSMGRGKLTVHGFRSSFRTWAAEQTNFAREVAEQALAHTVGDKVERSYRRTTLFDRRRALMTEWAKFCTSPATPAAAVVPIGAAR